MSGFGDHSILIAERIEPNGCSSGVISIRDAMPMLRLEKLDRFESRDMPARQRFHALRFTFFHQCSRKHYVVYRVITAAHPYLLPGESKFAFTMASRDPSTNMFWREQPKAIILGHQRMLYAERQDEEYAPQPSPKTAPTTRRSLRESSGRQASVADKPEVFLNIYNPHQRDTFGFVDHTPKSITLTNRGKITAYSVQVESLKLTTGIALFKQMPALVADAEMAVAVEIKGPIGEDMAQLPLRDLDILLEAEWHNKQAVMPKLEVPFVITYRDSADVRFRTDGTLVYHAGTNDVEATEFRFRQLQPSIPYIPNCRIQ